MLLFEPLGCRSDLKILFNFLMKILLANRIAPDGMPHFRRHIWGYSVCLCPIKGTPCLNELSLQYLSLVEFLFGTLLRIGNGSGLVVEHETE